MTSLIRCANKLTKYLVPPNGWRGERVGEHLRKLRALLLGRAAAAEEKGKGPVPNKATTAAAEEKGKGPVPNKATTAAAEEKGKGSVPNKATTAAAEEKGKGHVPNKATAAISSQQRPSGGDQDGAAAEAVAAVERALALRAIDALEATLACATALGVPASLIHVEPRLTLPLEEWPSGMHLQVRALMASNEL